ncbi:chromate transporter [Anoxybacteroides tepidamans]|uniref:chromate transporter n=1 Tax=Anoxybacteroides tepidamans TaxID=265948 RepID=UPI000551EE60|nr:chromate transporter [Anoxybacillus tepidamans]
MQNMRSKSSVLEVLKVSLKLGLTSFGGPIAHLAYFRDEYVNKRKWIDEATYAELVALCQFLPGPSSSQVGMGIGLLRAGVWGALAAWLGFTLPSALALMLFAYFYKETSLHHLGWLHGLLVATVAVVAQAVWGMAQNFASDRLRATIAVAVAMFTLLVPHVIVQISAIVGAGIAGTFLFRNEQEITRAYTFIPISQRTASKLLFLFAGLLALLPVVRLLFHSHIIALIDSFYRAGAFVFGGGHVVLPLLQSEVVPAGWVTEEQFLAGYGAAQAVPGPLFTFASYIGMASFGWIGAIIATMAIFFPSFLLVFGVLPFWNSLRHHPRFQAALKGVNASVVGILLAALYDPVWTKAIQGPLDFCLALLSFSLLLFWKCPPWLVVAISAASGMLFL